MPGPKTSQKNLFIAFDAFGTLFSPRAPIGTQYGEVARKHGICKDISDDEIMSSFKAAFKYNAKERPNFGKEVGMDPTAWWSGIITQTFAPFLEPTAPDPNSLSQQPLPTRLIPDLLTRFASATGYALHADVIPLFTRVRALKQFSSSTTADTARRKIITAVLTNSDDRVAGILRSFGLRVGHLDPATLSSSLLVASSPSPRSSPSNSQGSTLLPAEHLGDNDIDFVLTSYDCGFEKPHRGIFDAAMAVAMARARFAWGVDGAEGKEEEEWETVYVGDEVDKDTIFAAWKG
ncbi:hypothetical protein MPH_02376 [Macrophomina phaseolina MS6]|uniref:Haloacid dehalogenase-like hydrolase n=1 Tax=Macrophomina phaseolina (strain MS6) TaxID=1126212 RepID=K2SCX2_MACPH|nr:hypothetical protein MPH_02376 [Macrophomina phaseolina MS6]